MRNVFKVTCENGDTWVTEMNCNLETAEKYFLLGFKIYENFETGEETKVLITNVAQLNKEEKEVIK